MISCMDETEREPLLRERIKTMPPERFEQLVYELAHREDERVERLEHPDGGADTILPRRQGKAERVWQAKRYPRDINWRECEKSLADALKRWQPAHVTFAFPRDLSETLRASFDKRLVSHPDAVAAKASVDHWNLSRIMALLGRHRDLAHRFWPDLEPQTDRLDRVIKAGGKLETAEDLVERAQAFGEFSDRDPDFKTTVTSGGLDTEAPDFKTLPYMTLAIRGESAQVHVATWVRDGAEVEPPSLAFTEDEAGQAARMEAVRTLAVGETATVTGGFRVAVVAPEILKDLTQGVELGPGSFDLVPGDPLTVRLEIDAEARSLAYEVALRPVPPPPGAAAAWAGFIGRTLLELSFTLLDKPAIRAGLSLKGELDGSAAERAEAATLMHAFYAHDEIRVSSDVLFPGGQGLLSGRFEKQGDDVSPADMGVLRDYFTAVAFIERQLGIDLPLPPHVSPEEMDAALTIAHVLRTGEGSATLTSLEGEVEDPTAIPNLAAIASRQPTVREVTYSLFGKTLSLGRGEYVLPPLKVVRIIPLGTTPTAPARVTLTADGDPDMTFRLLDWTPPEDDAGGPDG